MPRNEDILDDIDINIQEDAGTNLQLFRGFVLAVVIQFLLWILTFKLLDATENILHHSLIDINVIDYRLSGATILISLCMMIGATTYLFLSNASNQAYLKLLTLGFIFSFLAIIDIYTWRSISEGKEFISLASRHLPETLFITLFHFTMLIGLILIFKKKLWYIGVLLLFSGFILMGFIK